jgi:hypothetical protein
MGYVICWEHNTVTAWGCPECREEERAKIIGKAIEETREAIRKAFEAPPEKAMSEALKSSVDKT